MTLTDVKKHMGRQVILNHPKYAENALYLLTACILRKNENNQFVYTAELTDIKTMNSVCIVPLDYVEEV